MQHLPHESNFICFLQPLPPVFYPLVPDMGKIPTFSRFSCNKKNGKMWGFKGRVQQLQTSLNRAFIYFMIIFRTTYAVLRTQDDPDFNGNQVVPI